MFDLGLKTFGSDPDYLVKYLDFLLQSNNDSSAFLSLFSPRFVFSFLILYPQTPELCLKRLLLRLSQEKRNQSGIAGHNTSTNTEILLLLNDL